MIGQFEELLQSLGKVFHLDLKIDRFHACSIQVHERLTVQLQLDTAQENLWIFSKVIEIPPGKFRENVLFEALKSNGLPDPRPAVLCYVAKDHALALCQKYPLSILNGERLGGLVGSFLEMADSWYLAISSGKPAPASK